MNRYREGKRIAYWGIAANGLLAIMKITAGIMVNSHALTADGFHSISDIVSTVVVLIAINVSRKPPDASHHYGHGQAEPIAAKLLGIILMFTGTLLAVNTVRDIFQSQVQIPGLTGFWIAIFSIFLKEIMFRFTRRAGEKTNNQALIADAWHHRSDAITSVAAAAGIMGSYLGYPVLDPVAGIVVAVMIVKMGWDITRNAIRSLMITSPSQQQLEEINEITEMVNGVIEVGELRAHHSGSDLYIDLKIKVDYRISVLEGHQIATEVKDRLIKEFVETEEVMVHVEPMVVTDIKRRSENE